MGLVFMSSGKDKRTGVTAAVFKKFREDEITIKISNRSNETAVIDWATIMKLMNKVELMETREEKKQARIAAKLAKKKPASRLQRKIDKQRKLRMKEVRGRNKK